MRLLVFGLGYIGTAVARAAVNAGATASGTVRDPATPQNQDGIHRFDFAAAADAIASATHVLSTVPPGADGDPILRRYAAHLATAADLRWIGYVSSTGVYGDRDGGWVDESTIPAPTSDRSRRRLAAENEWRQVSRGWAVDVFRVAGIYGPGRSPFSALRTGTARRIAKPGHAFCRIHRDDIVRAVLAAMQQQRGPEVRVLNLADDAPAESADVVREAARLLGVPPPAAVAFDEAVTAMSAMARSFWAENRKVSSRRTQQALGLHWRYPNYRDGLRAILAEERAQGLA